MNRTTEILTVAKEILESEIDWCQGSTYIYGFNGNGETDYGRVVSACALGAIDLAVKRVMPAVNFGIKTRWYAFDKAENRLYKHVPVECCSIPGYNDLDSTSKEDVLLMFKRAIEAE